MDRRERYSDPEEALRVALLGWQTRIWTVLPGIVQSYDPTKMTCVVQPAIQGQVFDEAGNMTVANMPLLLDCPVVFPSGGGCTLTFPIAAGDECKISFSSRCIDAWWQLGGVQPQAEFRMHDLSDGFVEVGPRSQPRVLSGLHATAAELRTDDGQAFVRVDASGHHVRVQTTADVVVQTGGNLTGTVGGSATLTAPEGINLNGVTIDASGNVTAPAGATITAPNVVGVTNVTFGGKSGIAHTHGGVSTGSGHTAGPD